MQHILRRAAQQRSPAVKGLRLQRHAGLQQCGQWPVGGGNRRRIAHRGRRHRGRRRALAQVKAQVDAVGALHAQLQCRQVGSVFQRLHGCAHGSVVLPGHDKPQVVVVLALIVVVDAGVRRHLRRHGVQSLGRHRHGGQQRGAASVASKHAANTAQSAAGLQLRVAGQHRLHAHAGLVGNVLKRRAHQRKTALPRVEQRQL